MKEGWEIKRLVEVSTFFEDGNWIESKDQSIDGIRLIQTGNVGNGVFKNKKSKARYISEETFKQLRCTEIFQGDCLVSRLPDPIGRACILPYLKTRMITAVDCSIIRFDDKIIMSEWFVYYTLSNFYFNEIQHYVTGATRQRISRKNLGLISIPIPSLTEQKRIVSILDEAFAKIETLENNAKQNLENAKELFESYLQNIFEKKGKDWEVKALGEVCELSAGGDVPKNDFSKELNENHKVPIFSNGEKNEGLYGFTSEPKIFKPSITVSARGTIGYSIKRLEPFYPVVRLIVVTPKDLIQLDLDFLNYYLKTIDFKHSGTSIPQLTVPMIKDYKILIPPSEQQKSIIRRFDILYAKTQKLESFYQQKLEALEELKKSILEKAFKGELSLEKIEAG